MANPETNWGLRTVRFRGPAFRAAALRLIADLCSDPLTTAIRNDILAFHQPVWSDDARQILVLLGERLSDAVTVAIRKSVLPFVETLDPSQGLLAVQSTFALSRSLHLFRAEPSVTWTTFSEPQLTKGFAHFLNASGPAARIQRVQALLKALGAAKLSNDIDEVVVTAEAPTSSKKRIDLLVEWWDSSEQRYAVAMEAKLGHHVTSGQLPAYRNHLRRIPKERRLLVVVSPRLTDRTDRSLQRNRDWRWMAWHDLLVGHERTLPERYDDVAYTQFRRTLWDQTG